MPTNDCKDQPDMAPFTARKVYDHLPLAPGSHCIRVLDVHQSDPADSNRLTGTLRTVDLRALPKFTALSYVWGHDLSHKIACNGGDINITQSCYEALASLRESCRPLTIWVDAICINQEDNSEKEQQIVLMGSIYTLAETVYVWLGVGNTETDQAAEYIHTISQFRKFPAQIPLIRNYPYQNTLERLAEIGRHTLPLAFRAVYIGPHVGNRYERDIFMKLIETIFFPKFIYSDEIEQLSSLPFLSQDVINTLLDHTWLSRAWTFQEMTLASNPVLVCGRQHIPWLVMHQALTFIEDSATQALTDSVNRVVSKAQRRVHNEVLHSDLFKKWQALFDVWQTIPRHSKRSRYWLSPGQDNSWSVHYCVQNLKTTRNFQETLRLLACLLFLSSIGLTIMLPVALTLSRWHLALLTYVTIGMFFVINLERLMHLSLDCMKGSKTRMYSLICHTSPQPQKNLVALAQAIRDRNSKWPHDRVYAIDSVLRQLGAQPPTPDYQKPLGRVYRDALVGLMEWSPTLIILLVDCGSRLPDAPSWVPDWSQDNKSWVPDSYIYHGVEKRSWTEQDLAQSVSGNILSVKAACLGTSIYCLTLERNEDGDTRSNNMTTNGKLIQNVHLLAQWILRIRKDTLVFRLHESIPLTIMLTLTGRSIPCSEITSEQEHTFRHMFEIITQLGVEVDRVLEDTTAVAAATTRALEAICQSEGCRKFFLDTCNRIAGRRGLIVSDNGLIGSGPISMKRGDTITLIKGVSVPMALRKIGEDYQVLGPVFIDGFMGLPTENSQRMNLNWETFRLV